MLEALKKEVYEANLELARRGLAIYTWGNASGIDREAGLIVIKPSGVDYGKLRPEDMAVVDLDGRTVEGSLRPSSDTPTHIELYKAFPKIGGVAHTHSIYATAFAQSGRAIPACGTTHADYFHGPVPCARALTEAEVAGEYEKNTGLIIAELFCGIDPLELPACLVKSHGPFSWGRDCAEAVYHAAVLEYCAQMAAITEALGAGEGAPRYLLDRHYYRKHGKNAYYGQRED